MAHILVADDEESMRTAIKRSLEACGHRVTTAIDGAEEMALLQDAKNNFDLVISDNGMPGITGLEVLLRLRVAKNNVKFALYSAGDEPDLGLVCKKHGAVFWAKPIRNLATRINEILAA